MTDTLDSLPPVAVCDPPIVLADIVAAEKPVVVRGVIDHWPALTEGRASPQRMNAYLKAMDRGAMAPVMEAPAGSGGRYVYGADMREFTFSKRQRGLSETLDQIEGNLGMADAPFLAIQMLPLTQALPQFVSENPLTLFAQGVIPRLWIGGPLKTQTHNDRDHNLACVVAGHRRFVLFPPDQVANLYVGPLDFTLAGQPVSLADPDKPDFARFPQFRQAMAAALTAELEPGDAIHIPSPWWHHVAALSPFNILVNYWWRDYPPECGTPFNVLIHGLLALRHLPAAERDAWRAMIDHYIFDDNGDPAAHLPEAARSVLGPMTPALAAHLRQWLAGQLKD